MKVALCLSGQLRTYKKDYDILYDKILKPYSPDVYLATWEQVGTSCKRQKFNVVSDKELPYLTNDHTDELIDLKFIKEKFNPSKLFVKKFLDEYCDNVMGVRRPDYLKENIKQDIWGKYTIPMYYLMYECNKLVDASKKIYDAIIYCRPDAHRAGLRNVNIRLNEVKSNSLYVIAKSEAAHRGIKHVNYCPDKFAIGDSSSMNYYMSLFLKLNDYWYTELGEPLPKGERMGEKIMRHHILSSDLFLQYRVSGDLPA